MSSLRVEVGFQVSTGVIIRLNICLSTVIVAVGRIALILYVVICCVHVFLTRFWYLNLTGCANYAGVITLHKSRRLN